MKTQEETNRLLISQISDIKKSLNERPSGSGKLPSTTIANPRGDAKAITTRSGASYKGPKIPSTSFSSPEVLEKEAEVTTDTIPPIDKGSNNDVPPPVIQVPATKNKVVPETPPVPVENPKTTPKSSIPYPSRLSDQKLREKASHQMDKFYQIFQELHFDISFADAIILMPKFASTLKHLLSNKEKLFEMAKTPLNENCSAVLLKKLP